ncbi:MAG: carboxypeptidase-like regulatory domain-containing protein [Candidatus Dojkabacteria bacterium]|nr:carboxypeptidase-like regulatory domain-containing protein [Candidatus Dojkabacteria bacterium]
MKKFLIILVFILCLIGGYLLGSFYPINGFLSNKTDIATDTSEVLTVTVLDEDEEPMVGIEIDVSEQNGPPEAWGIKEADTSGKAIYNLEPGTYYIFFNTNRFPLGYVIPREQEITIVKGEPKEITIVLEKTE